MQARFTEALLRGLAKVTVPGTDIYSTTLSGQPKSDILLQLAERHPGAACHFVEDKLSTLEKARHVCRFLWVLAQNPVLHTQPRASAACIRSFSVLSSAASWLHARGPYAGVQGARAERVGAVLGGLGVQHC